MPERRFHLKPIFAGTAVPQRGDNPDEDDEVTRLIVDSHDVTSANSATCRLEQDGRVS
jgi:hypothetical protein